MYDVADGDEYMPGAECEDCHMPKTNKAETRISHGMKPMLPGDAEKWQAEAGYAAGQDSCSGCHPSRTRDQLQANIDDVADRRRGRGRRCGRGDLPPRRARSSPRP